MSDGGRFPEMVDLRQAEAERWRGVMSETDGIWRLSDGKEKHSVITVQNGWVQEVQGLWRSELEGLSLKQLEELAERQKLQLKKEWDGTR